LKDVAGRQPSRDTSTTLKRLTHIEDIDPPLKLRHQAPFRAGILILSRYQMAIRHRTESSMDQKTAVESEVFAARL
jgi:hypothetical protein